MAENDTREFFSRCVDDNLDALFGVALRMTGRSADAEDLVAETVSKAWAAIESLEDRSKLRPWIFRILRNCYLSEYRKRSARPSEAVYDELADGKEESEVCPILMNESDDFLRWWSTPEQEYFSGLLGEQIMAAIAALPEAFRTTILLVNVEGLTYDEAAEALGVPRGRTMLQKSLWLQARDAGLAPDHEESTS
jgi:RNA polymerase sigma-70 factor (ECF subfamily)